MTTEIYLDGFGAEILDAAGSYGIITIMSFLILFLGFKIAYYFGVYLVTFTKVIIENMRNKR